MLFPIQSPPPPILSLLRLATNGCIEKAGVLGVTNNLRKAYLGLKNERQY